MALDLWQEESVAKAATSFRESWKALNDHSGLVVRRYRSVPDEVLMARLTLGPVELAYDGYFMASLDQSAALVELALRLMDDAQPT